MTSSGVDQQVAVALSARGVRYTAGRKRVIAALAETEGPRTAAELHGKLSGSVPLSSLYRSLAVLDDAGVLATHHGPKGVTRFELAESIVGHHHHLTCVECGTVGDVALERDLEDALEDLVSRVAASRSFLVAGHALDIDGRCAQCA